MDSARRVTDQQISAMRREFAADYDQLGGSMSARLSEYLADFVDEEGNVEATALAGRRWARMRDQLARECTELNSESMRTLDGRLGEVRQMTAEGSPVQSAVPHPTIDQRVDVAWNRRKVEAVARQGIGRTPAEAGERMRRVADMNSNATARRVRTAVNGAENSGRMDAMLARGGSKRWITMADERVRDSHAALHGVVVPVDEPFGNGLMFPGDPSGPPEEVYNCRCSLEWVDTDGTQPEELSQEWEMAEGQDILGTWERRPDQFDFEIDDVIAAQGFDGKPRIVNADEFDRAVKQANGGDGLIMQRVYSAPDQATLDAYRESLYDGKWYVDCSHGNDTYGKGMYTASSKSTSVTQQMADEIAPYRREFSYTETMTLDPSARTIGYNELVAARNDASVLERAIVGSDDISDTERAIVRREVLREYSDEDRALARTAEREWDFDDYMDVIKKYSQREREFRELGTSEVAALLGYDAVEVPGLNYTVVLNRTKLIIRRP